MSPESEDEISLWGGPKDGEQITVHAMTNSTFYVTDKAGGRHWYRYQPGQHRATYLGPSQPWDEEYPA